MVNHTLTDLWNAYKGIINIYDKFPTIPEQIVHAHSELSEVYDCHYKPHKHQDPQMDITDELCDTILSCIALSIKSEISAEQLEERMQVSILKNYEWAEKKRNQPEVPHE